MRMTSASAPARQYGARPCMTNKVMARGQSPRLAAFSHGPRAVWEGRSGVGWRQWSRRLINLEICAHPGTTNRGARASVPRHPLLFLDGAASAPFGGAPPESTNCDQRRGLDVARPPVSTCLCALGRGAPPRKDDLRPLARP